MQTKQPVATDYQKRFRKGVTYGLISLLSILLLGGWLLKENPDFKRFLGEYQQ